MSVQPVLYMYINVDQGRIYPSLSGIAKKQCITTKTRGHRGTLQEEARGGYGSVGGQAEGAVRWPKATKEH